jgi:hypothetical protein
MERFIVVDVDVFAKLRRMFVKKYCSRANGPTSRSRPGNGPHLQKVHYKRDRSPTSFTSTSITHTATPFALRLPTHPHEKPHAPYHPSGRRALLRPDSHEIVSTPHPQPVKGYAAQAATSKARCIGRSPGAANPHTNSLSPDRILCRRCRPDRLHGSSRWQVTQPRSFV